MISRESDWRRARTFVVLEDGTRWEPIYDGKRVLWINALGQTQPSLSVGEEQVWPLAGDPVEKGRVLYPSGLETPPTDDHTKEVQSLFRDIETYLDYWTPIPVGFRRIAAGYVLMTWLQHEFRSFPYLQFLGETGSGKTRCYKAVGRICYHPIIGSGADSEASIFRTLDTYPGTYLIDEADYRSSKSSDLITKILTQGSDADGTISRCGSDRVDFATQVFKVGGPKMLTSREPMEDRAIAARTFRLNTSQLPYDPLMPIEDNGLEEEALGISNRLLWVRLSQTVGEVEAPAWSHAKNLGHTARVAMPLYRIAVQFDLPGLAESLEEHVQIAADLIREDRSYSNEASVIKALLAFQTEQDNPLVGSIARWIETQGLPWDAPFGKVEPRKVGAVLQRLGSTTTRTNKGRIVNYVLARLRKLAEDWDVS